MPKSFSHKLTLAGAGQKTHETCWLASYKMIMTAANKSTYPIEGRLRAAGIDFDDYYKNGMPDTVYTKAAGALGLQHWPGSTFNAKPGFFDVGLTDGAEAPLAGASSTWAVSRRAIARCSVSVRRKLFGGAAKRSKVEMPLRREEDNNRTAALGCTLRNRR